MGQLEEESKKRRRRTNLKKIILGTLFVTGALGVTLLAPNVVGVLKRQGFFSPPRQKETIASARERLIREGLIENTGALLRITPKGERELRLLDSGAYQLKKPKRWDGRWRVLIFDIPEHRRSLRNKLRQTLAMVGFVRLQDSVWLYPYDCEDFVALLKTDFRIGKDMLYLIVDALENDRTYRAHFGF